MTALVLKPLHTNPISPTYNATAGLVIGCEVGVLELDGAVKLGAIVELELELELVGAMSLDVGVGMILELDGSS